LILIFPALDLRGIIDLGLPGVHVTGNGSSTAGNPARGNTFPLTLSQLEQYKVAHICLALGVRFFSHLKIFVA
jgi:hypothetical protein